jgi:hypothetical protein
MHGSGAYFLSPAFASGSRQRHVSPKKHVKDSALLNRDGKQPTGDTQTKLVARDPLAA